MAKSKMNKNKIFTSAKKIFKSRDELEQEEVLDIEQQDIAQEIEQLRAEIKAFYLEHPDKDPSMPDKIYVKDMNELEEKITEHIPKKVVEDEIVIKNIIEQDGPAGSNPLDFSRMKEYDLPSEYRSQVFSPDIIDTENETKQDTIIEQGDKKSDADTIREIFGEELFQEMGNTAEEEEQSIVTEEEVNEMAVDLSTLRGSLDQDLLKQLQEQRMEEEQDSDLKNRVFTHRTSSKSNSITFGEESEDSEKGEQDGLAGQTDDDTQNMSDLLSRLLSEGKLEADLHNEDFQEDNGEVVIPGLDMEDSDNSDHLENADDESDCIEMTDSRSQEDINHVDAEEAEEVHESNLSDLLSNLLSKGQKSEEEEQSPETDTEDTQEYRNRVFISSVKAAKKMQQSGEHSAVSQSEEKINNEAGSKPSETVIFQEYGDNDDEQIEINLGGLGRDSSEKEDITSEQESSIEEQSVQIPEADDEFHNQSKQNTDKGDIETNLVRDAETETSNTKKKRDDINHKLFLGEGQEKTSQLDEYGNEVKMSSGNIPDKIMEMENEERESEQKDREELSITESENNTEQTTVNEYTENGPAARMANEFGKDEMPEKIVQVSDYEEPKQKPESPEPFHGSKQMNDVGKTAEFVANSALDRSEKIGQLDDKSPSEINKIENILNSLMEDSDSGRSHMNQESDFTNKKKESTPKGIASVEKELEEGIAAYFHEDHVTDKKKVIPKKISDPASVVVPEKKRIVAKVTKEEKLKKPAARKVPEEKITTEKIKEEKQASAEIVKADSSSHAVKVLTEEKKQSLLSRLIQKIKELFKKKTKMEIVSQEAVAEENNVFKGQEKETFINGLITGSVSGDNVTLNPLAVVKKDVIAQGKVLCLSGAAIMGKVSCDSIIVEGTVFGEIEARGKVIIKNDALVMGNIYSSDVLITQGAMVQGDIFFKNPERKGK